MRLSPIFSRALDQIRRLNEWRLSTKIMVLFFAVALTAIFFFSRQSGDRATQTLTDAQGKILSGLAGTVATEVQSQVLQYRRDAVQVATDPEVITFMSLSPAGQAQAGPALLQRLAPALTADPDYRQLLILDPGGSVVLSNQDGAGSKDYSASDFFVQGRAAGADNAYVSDIKLSNDRASQELFAVLPIRDGGGNLLGVAAVRLVPDHLAAPLKSKELAAEHRDGYLVGPQGTILANSVNPDQNYRSLGALDSGLAARVTGASSSGFSRGHLVSSRQADAVAWAPVPEQRWTVMVSEDQAVFAAASADLSQNQFLNAAVLSLIIGSLVIFAGRMFENTERESLSDPLTGLANRRFLQEIMLRELRRAQRSGKPVSVIIADIDHFKRINDSHGHNVGDEVLSRIGSLLLANVRATDFVVRYGGEEFIILMPETRATDAAAVADKLRLELERFEIESTIRPDIKLAVTISCGVAAFPIDGETGEQVILRADRALYWAKQNGRNKVAMAHGVEPVGGAPGSAEPAQERALDFR